MFSCELALARSPDFADFMIVRSAARAQLAWRKVQPDREKNEKIMALPREVCDFYLDAFAYWLQFHHYQKSVTLIDVDDSIRDVFNNVDLESKAKDILLEARRGGNEEKLDVINLRFELLMLPIKRADFVSEPVFLGLVSQFLEWTNSRHDRP